MKIKYVFQAIIFLIFAFVIYMIKARFGFGAEFYFSSILIILIFGGILASNSKN